jgi:hypothetical protein
MPGKKKAQVAAPGKEPVPRSKNKRALPEKAPSPAEKGMNLARILDSSRLMCSLTCLLREPQSEYVRAPQEPRARGSRHSTRKIGIYYTSGPRQFWQPKKESTKHRRHSCIRAHQSACARAQETGHPQGQFNLCFVNRDAIHSFCSRRRRG